MNRLFAPIYGLCMFAGMMIFLEIGRRLGKRSLAKDPQGSIGIGVVQGAVFSLFGLLVSFTFSGAPARLDARKRIIQDEANAIGTAYLRLDLLPPASQPAMRERFRNYVDSRLEAYRQLPDVQAAEAELSRSAKIESDIWTRALVASRLPSADPDAFKLLIPSLNEMFDIASSRTMSTVTHPPLTIYALLFLLALPSSALAGHGMAGSKQRNWLLITGFAAVYVISVYATLEIEYPRMGILSSMETRYDQVLVNVREA